jgi:hypothetical protein
MDLSNSPWGHGLRTGDAYPLTNDFTPPVSSALFEARGYQNPAGFVLLEIPAEPVDGAAFELLEFAQLESD